jgi:hypothetical protein
MLILDRDLGQLIIQLNPKTKGRAMHLTHVDPSTAQNGGAVNQFQLELEDNPNYQLRWSWVFRGQERFLMRAIRISYRYPILGEGGPLATDYVLIGYEGGGGP